jgi:hypothetical protein
MRPTTAQVAKALIYQHGFDYDIAYLSAHYGSGKRELPTATPYQILAWIERVKHVPNVSETEAKRMLTAYSVAKASG